MWTAVCVLVGVWLVFLVSRHTLGGWAHSFLLASIALGLWQILRGRKIG